MEDTKTESQLLAELSALTKDKKRWEGQLSAVGGLLGHPSGKVQAKALWLLGEMGLLHPGKAEPYLPQIAAMLEDPRDKIRERAVGALGRIGRGDSAAVLPYRDRILKRAKDEAPLVRMNVIWAAENIAVNAPELFADVMDLFAALLDDPAPRVRIEAPEIFRVIGKRNPLQVQPYLEKLRYLSEHDEDRVVRIHSAGAVKAATQNTHP